jgi:hypothetical protein
LPHWRPSARVQRPAELGDIEITIAPSETITAETITAYADLGVSRLLVRPPQAAGVEAVEQSIREFAHLM